MNNNDTVSALRSDAIRALTALGRHTYTNGAQLDFADVLASVLASAAANVGGTDYLLAGRSGSWEAGLVESLITGTVPEDELVRYRTEPVIVPLNVAQLIDQTCRDAGYDEALGRLVEEHADDETPDQFERREGELRSSYAAAFRNYALKFERSVAEAGTTLAAPTGIVVDADLDPQSEWWADGARRNPSDYDGDPLVWRLWSQAYEAVGAPSVEPLTSR